MAVSDVTLAAATTDESVLAAMRILIVDDQAFNIAVMLAEAGYTNAISTRDPRTVPEVCAAHRAQFDPRVAEALLELDFDALQEGAAGVHG